MPFFNQYALLFLYTLHIRTTLVGALFRDALPGPSAPVAGAARTHLLLLPRPGGRQCRRLQTGDLARW